VHDPAGSLAELDGLFATGGELAFQVADWNELPAHGDRFSMIVCRNGLRLSTKPYWRRSLRSFFRLLDPGGLLVIQTINAIGIRGEVDAMLQQEGFCNLTHDRREPDKRYVAGLWPTG